MRVTRVAEHPRITKPFSDESWAALDALGRKVDAALEAGDVRLTMGGEPTFVSIDDFEAEEWNTSAVGPTKRGLADQSDPALARPVRTGGFLHFGQGKWYPGETLPRWTFSLYWRTRRQADLVRSQSDCPRRCSTAGAKAAAGRSAVAPTSRRPWAWHTNMSCPPLKTLPLDHQGRQSARQRDAREFQAGRPRRTRSHRAGFRARA